MTRPRVGIIGLGMAVGPHAQSLRDLEDRVEVAGAFSPSAERREAFARSTGFPVNATADELFDDPTIDGLMLLTPTLGALAVLETGRFALWGRKSDAPPAPPAAVTAGVACSNYSTVMGDAGFPRDAIRQGLEKGEALIQFTLTASGEIKDIKAVRASHPIFARNSIRIVGEYKCQGQGRDVTVTVPFGYKLE